MHVAICDDNVADRKHLERLLGRESDRRLSLGESVLYVDSYGNASALLAHPMQYDVFFLDICMTAGTSALQVVEDLLAKGVNAPFVLCVSKVDYRKQNFPEGILYLEKEIHQEQLREVLSHAQRIYDAAEPMIELREEKDTFYVREREILYAEENGSHLNVTMQDGTVHEIFGNAESFFGEVENQHPSFVMASLKTILNCRYIREFRFPHRAVMTDGKVFSVIRACMPYARKMQEAYREES